MLPRITLPPTNAALAGLAALFILPGLASHDLWKTQDAIGLGVVYGMATSGDLVVPRIAGELWLYDQPLYHWIALACGKLFSGFLEFHAAARLASGVFVAAAFVLIYLAARQWSDPELRRTSGCGALLMLLGCIGLLVHAHEALPELASLAAMCGALAALPYAARRPLLAGAAFGVALGLAFLSATWIAPAALAAAVVIAHFVCPEWRSARGALFLALAAASALIVGASWPLALALRAPDAFLEWRTILAWRQTPPGENLRHFFATASWFAWPAWPLALWTAWALRRRWREPQLFVPAVTVLLMLPAMAIWGQRQSVTLIPILAPLVLLAVQGLHTLRRGAAAALDWFGLVTFAFFAGLVWVGYVAMISGVPPRIAHNFAKTAPGFVAEFNLLHFLIALALTLGWLYLTFFTAYSPTRSIARWAAGVVLLWGAFAMLWMPWADYQKSYRSVALQLRSKIPVDASCIAQRGLGVPQGAALDYHADIRPRAFDFAQPRACPLLLVQGSPQHEFDAPGKGWAKLADVGRPGDRAERYRLYRLDR
jgi:4-amino-4-deoxy-L-arabinose transferase-like glycosyltransferase